MNDQHQQAIERLRGGNRRFVSGMSSAPSTRPQDLAEGQHPFAIVLGCSDSRVPVEIVFDQGLGDLFVIRVAGNIAESTQIGSVEFAADNFGAPLVVVLGHSKCGAVTAAIDTLTSPAPSSSQNLRSIVEHIRPSVEPLLGTQPREDLVREAVRANIHRSVAGLHEGSELLAGMIEAGELVVVGAEYDLETGSVEFFDGA